MRVKSALAAFNRKLDKVFPESAANKICCGAAIVASAALSAMGMDQLGIRYSPRTQEVITELFDLYRIFGNEDIADFVRNNPNLSGVSHLIAGFSSGYIGIDNLNNSNEDNPPPPSS